MNDVTKWLPVLARIVVVAAVAGPMSEKFLNYPGQVAFFTRLGIPQPGIMVIVSGLVELAAMIMLALGVAGRLAALMLLGNMGVAILTAGVNALSAIVIAGSALIALLGTGPYSLWQPEEAILRRRQRGIASGPAGPDTSIRPSTER